MKLNTSRQDNSGRKHVHIQLTSYYQGFITSFRAGLLTVGANVSTIFEMFKNGKFVWPVSWAGLYSAQADYIFLEMGEYYKHKKERNSNNGGNCK